MKPWLKNTLTCAAWIGVVAYIIIATVSARSHRKALRIDRVDIKIADSSAIANLVTRQMVKKWIDESKIKTVGEAVDSLRLSELEHYICLNGFVDKAKCYTSYSGALHVEVTQLRPAIRVLLDGYNSYITEQGDVFGSPASSSRYTPVITGSYTPLFRAGYSGNIHDVYKAQVEEVAAEMKRIETKNIYPLYQKRIEVREELRKVNSRYIGRRFGESRKVFEQKVIELKERNSKDRAILQRQLHYIEVEIKAEERKQKVFADKQKKLEKKYEDFINLIIFVNIVENDKFWGSEIVQIVASETTNGELRLELIPRSGDHTIIFGSPYDVEERLDNAKRFYREVLPNEGWGEFKSINVEYKNQIVCK